MILESAGVIAAPSARQVRLVRAAVLPGASALAAWRAWQRDAPLETLEPDSQWLLPLLYCNLRQAGAAEPLLRRYANVYRHNWYKNQLLLRAAGRVLGSAGPAALLLGGAALAAGTYDRLGARPIESVSVLCRAPGDWAQRLAEAGWQAAAGETASEMDFTDAFGRRIELRSTLLDAAQDAALLARARRLRVGGATLRGLSALDQLVLVLAKRDEGDSRSRWLWVADAAQILRGPNAAGHAALMARASELGLEAEVAQGWHSWRDTFGLTGEADA